MKFIYSSFQYLQRLQLSSSEASKQSLMRSHFLVSLMHWSPSPHNISELLHFGLLFWQSISSEESPQSSRPLHVHFILVQFPLLQVNLSDVHVMLASGKKKERNKVRNNKVLRLCIPCYKQGVMVDSKQLRKPTTSRRQNILGRA